MAPGRTTGTRMRVLVGALVAALCASVQGAIVSVVGGDYHTCALSDANVVKCFGFNNDGQLGAGKAGHQGDEPFEMGANLTAVDVGSGLVVAQLSAGGNTTCVLLQPGGKVKCWGSNSDGQLGQGSTVSTLGLLPTDLGDNLPPIDLGTGAVATQICTGGNHVCAVLDNLGVKCWGMNIYGQLGQGDKKPRGKAPGEMGDALLPIKLGTNLTATAVSCGAFFTCVLLQPGGVVKCFGRNSQGQLGVTSSVSKGVQAKDMGDKLKPAKLYYQPTNTTFVATSISLGLQHSCAVLSDGGARCWGFNQFGQLGLGDARSRGNTKKVQMGRTPSIDFGGLKLVELVAGGYHTCNILSNATLDQSKNVLKCFGYNIFGELGLGSTDFVGDQKIEIGAGLASVDLGKGLYPVGVGAGTFHTCAILNTGYIKCWGFNDYGQLGTGDIFYRGDDPNEMGNKLAVVSL